MNYNHLFNFTKWDLYDSDCELSEQTSFVQRYDSQSGPSDLLQRDSGQNFTRSNGKVPTRINRDCGMKMWLKNGRFHRLEINHNTGLTLPAAIFSNGDKFWYFEGKQHRELTDRSRWDLHPNKGVRA